jgi:pantoate kinase
MEQVATAFPSVVPETCDDFFRLSRQFACDSGLMTEEVKRVLGACEEAGVLSSMTMLGNGVFACGKRAREVLGSFGNLYEFRMAESGARITGVKK